MPARCWGLTAAVPKGCAKAWPGPFAGLNKAAEQNNSGKSQHVRLSGLSRRDLQQRPLKARLHNIGPLASTSAPTCCWGLLHVLDGQRCRLGRVRCRSRRSVGRRCRRLWAVGPPFWTDTRCEGAVHTLGDLLAASPEGAFPVVGKAQRPGTGLYPLCRHLQLFLSGWHRMHLGTSGSCREQRSRCQQQPCASPLLYANYVDCPSSVPAAAAPSTFGGIHALDSTRAQSHEAPTLDPFGRCLRTSCCSLLFRSRVNVPVILRESPQRKSSERCAFLFRPGVQVPSHPCQRAIPHWTRVQCHLRSLARRRGGCWRPVGNTSRCRPSRSRRWESPSLDG